jgi:hypothetical protein
MKFLSIAAVGFLSTVLPAQQASSNQSNLPKVLINLPSDVRSETVHINYHMSGSFGGYGSFVKAEKDRHSYEIQAAVEGKPAKNIKIIAYIPSCEITTFDLAIENEKTIERYLECRTLPSQSITAKITLMPESEKSLEVAVSYLADWDHPFFGIMDGMVTMIPISTRVPDKVGEFRFEIPDFSRDPVVNRFSRREWGHFVFLLREVKTWNHVCLLAPVGSKSPAMGLEIQTSYPDVLEFTCEKEEARAK